MHFLTFVFAFLTFSKSNGFALDRRHFLAATCTPAAAVPVATCTVALPNPALAAATAAPTAETDLIGDLASAKSILADLPGLIGDNQWDPVRVQLRKPSVAALWNVNDSANTLRKLAKIHGDPEIIDAAEDVARNLRDVDQIVYSNVFSMEGKMAGAGLRTDGGAVGRAGGGGGKYRVDEPQQLLRAAVRSIDDVLAAVAND